jgi:hypothetical protein
VAVDPKRVERLEAQYLAEMRAQPAPPVLREPSGPPDPRDIWRCAFETALAIVVAFVIVLALHWGAVNAP